MIGPGSAAISIVHCTVLLYTVGATSWVPSSPLCPAVMVGGPGLAGSPDLDVVATGSPDDAQIEGARALALRPAQIMWLIVLPQAFRRLIPPTINLLASLI